MKWFWMLLAAAIVLLYLTNPTMDDFKEFVAEEAKRLVREQAGAPVLGDVLSNSAARLAENYAENVTSHEDYYLFSTYKINISPGNVTTRTWHFVGIGGTFINLSRFYDRE